VTSFFWGHSFRRTIEVILPSRKLLRGRHKLASATVKCRSRERRPNRSRGCKSGAESKRAKFNQSEKGRKKVRNSCENCAIRNTNRTKKNNVHRKYTSRMSRRAKKSTPVPFGKRNAKTGTTSCVQKKRFAGTRRGGGGGGKGRPVEIEIPVAETIPEGNCNSPCNGRGRHKRTNQRCLLRTLKNVYHLRSKGGRERSHANTTRTPKEEQGRDSL